MLCLRHVKKKRGVGGNYDVLFPRPPLWYLWSVVAAATAAAVSSTADIAANVAENCIRFYSLLLVVISC